MATPSVTFDPLTRELSSVPAFFSVRLPDGLRWTIEGHEAITPGATIGYWHWEDGTESKIGAPDGCSGFLVDVNDRVRFDLMDVQSQELLVLTS